MIRSAAESDIPAIYELIHENYVRVLSKVHSEAALTRNMVSLTQESFRAQMRVVHMTVLETEGRIAAVGFYANAGTAEAPDYLLTALFTRVDCHGQGLGARLFAHIAGQLRAIGAERLRVPASANAIPFYEKMGFIMDIDQPNIDDEINWMTARL